MKLLKQIKSLNFVVYLSIFAVTQVAGLLLSLSICFILQDFIWGFVRIALINSFILGISLISCSLLSQNLIFKIKNVYIGFISFSVILGTSIISFVVLFYSEPTLFIYYYRGAISFLFVNFLFIVALYIISSGLIIYREIMAEKEKALGNERDQKNQMKMKLVSSLEAHNRALEKASLQQKSMIKKLENEITERKRAEELNRMQQEKLIQADKMASVGILVSGVAHEINNPNNYMLLNSNNLAGVWNELRPRLDEYAKEKGDFLVSGLPYSELKEEVGDLISGISEGSERINTIVQSLKDFARQDPGRMNEIIDVNAVIKSSVVILTNLIKKSSDHFTTEYSEKLPKVIGNRQQIEQVIINLLSNSCQALENRNKAIAIRTLFDEDNRNTIITVKDEGKGIKAEDMKQIMDPFFTTKRDSGGTGLGLSISYNIIKDHNGDITFESEPGKGTRATIVLPVSTS